MTYYLGVDLGTSSLKIILGKDGELVGNTSSHFTLHSPQTGYSEENPADWKKAFDEAFMALIKTFPEIKTQPLMLGFSGQMHSLVLLDQQGEVLRPAILWNDSRTSKEVDFLKANYSEHLLRVEKNIPLDGFTLPKLLWVKNNEPSLWEKTWKFLLPKDYLIYYLTGKVLTEPSDASGTILYDLEKHQLDKELLRRLAIEAKKCPTVCSSTEIVGEMTADLKRKFSLEGPVSLVMGGADNACGAFGTISDPERQGLISVGTSGVVLVYENSNELNNLGKYHYFHSVFEKNYQMGVTLSAGYSLDWLKRLLAPAQSFAAFTSSAAKSPIGSLGLTFLPYLFGERSPYFDPTLSGSLLGLKAHHERADIIRAVMEGVTFSMRNVFEQMGLDAASTVDCFRVTGGVVKNAMWLQMFADSFNKNIEVLSFDEGPAYGALLCATVAGNEWHQWQNANTIKKIYHPIAANQADYQTAFDRFKRLSEASQLH